MQLLKFDLGLIANNVEVVEYKQVTILCLLDLLNFVVVILLKCWKGMVQGWLTMCGLGA